MASKRPRHDDDLLDDEVVFLYKRPRRSYPGQPKRMRAEEADGVAETPPASPTTPPKRARIMSMMEQVYHRYSTVNGYLGQLHLLSRVNRNQRPAHE